MTIVALATCYTIDEMPGINRGAIESLCIAQPVFTGQIRSDQSLWHLSILLVEIAKEAIKATEDSSEHIKLKQQKISNGCVIHRGEVAEMAKAYLEINEVDSLGKAATNLRDRLLIRLLFHLGCRVSEALALTVDNVDFGNGTVTIQHLKARLKLACPECNTRLGKSHTFCPNCGTKVEEALARELEHRRVRTLPLDNDTLNILRDYIHRGGPVRRDGKRLIFGINRHRAWQIVRECAEKAGLPDLINPETGISRVSGISPFFSNKSSRLPLCRCVTI